MVRKYVHDSRNRKLARMRFVIEKLKELPEPKRTDPEVIESYLTPFMLNPRTVKIYVENIRKLFKSEELYGMKWDLNSIR
ncbi:MAG TPA: hypothetical protein VGS11_04515 [Candidatus Bathyarchaeia archaeon]|nr:hypothetical protein [Candidatus Bathyarchaeia archaeon]